MSGLPLQETPPKEVTIDEKPKQEEPAVVPAQAASEVTKATESPAEKPTPETVTEKVESKSDSPSPAPDAEENKKDLETQSSVWGGWDTYQPWGHSYGWKSYPRSYVSYYPISHDYSYWPNDYWW